MPPIVGKKAFLSDIKEESSDKPRCNTKKWECEDIVISGISGKFPESDNFDEYAQNLYSNIDMVTSDNRRWPVELNDGLGVRAGKLKQIDKFDSEFFGVMIMAADAMDPHGRILLETAYECICDAGINPQSIRGTNTGVYVGINTMACADGIPQDDYQDIRGKEAGLWVQGETQTLYSNRISHIFDFNGPSYTLDTACSAFLVAFVNAVRDIRNGYCDRAIVGSANLVQSPFSNHIYDAMGILSSDGKCKVWDKSADGFVRSETIGCLLIQKKSEALRNYSTVIHVNTNTDGFKNIGLFSPFWLRQRNLMVQTYLEAGVDPHSIKFFESHGTGTNVGDPQEAKAIAEAYCSDGRKEPLLLGAVKSNLGHSEGASALCSIGKCILIFENKCIPANLHLVEPKPEIECIINKKVIPVMENTPFDGDIIGVNAFGVGGVNAHALLRQNDNVMNDESFKIADTIPRLINICGRNEEAVNHYFNFIENNPNKVSRDFLALLGESMKTNFKDGFAGFPKRGYMIIKENKTDERIEYEYKKYIETAEKNDSVWLIFSGMGSQWPGMAKDFMSVKTFANSINRAVNVLKPYNVDLLDLLLNNDETKLKNDVKSAFVTITAMQIALYDVINELNMKIDGIIGHSFGEIGCAYADGALTLEQAILTSYWRGKVVEDSKLPKGMLAAVGLSWNEVKKKCPNSIMGACHNGDDSVTISGLHSDMIKFTEQLKSENVFVRSVAGGEYPYHTPFMNAVVPKLLEALNSVIRKPKKRSNKWLSTAFPEQQWDDDDSLRISGEYFAHNLVSPVLFNEAMKKIPKGAVTIEVAPHSLFESIFKRCFSELKYIGLMKRNDNNNLDFILSSIGNLYTLGLNPNIENLYPKVKFPVARGTQSISSLMKWDHKRSYEIRGFPEYHNFSTASDWTQKVSLAEADWGYIRDHCVDGRVLFPATGYLFLVWRRIAAMKGQPWKKTPVEFENVRFVRPTLLSDDTGVKFVVRILNGTGDFIVSEGNAIAVTGRVIVPEDSALEFQDQLEDNDEYDESETELLLQKDIYKELRIRGYDYGKKFQGLIEAKGDGSSGKCEWTGDWISFLDSVMHLAIIALPIRALFVPIGFQSIKCNPNVLFDAIDVAGRYDHFVEKECKIKLNDESAHGNEEINIANELTQTFKPEIITLIGKSENVEFVDKENTRITPILPVKFNYNMRAMITKGIEIKGFLPVNIPRRNVHNGLTLEKYQFTPHNEEFAIEEYENNDIVEYIQVCCTLMKKLLEANVIVKKLDFNGYKETDESIVKRYVENPKQNQILMKLIYDIGVSKIDKNHNISTQNDKIIDLKNSIKNALSMTEYDLSLDILNSVWTHEMLIRPFLDIIIENTNDVKNINLKILEMNSSNDIGANKLMTLMRNSVMGFINFDYIIANPQPLALTDDIKALNVRIIEWDDHQKFLNEISELNLLIYKPNVNIEKLDMNAHLKSLSNTLKENGFLILSYRTMLTPAEDALYDITSHPHSSIISEKTVENFVNSAESNGFKLIGKKHETRLASSVVFFRKVKSEPSKYSPIIINILNRKYDQWLNTLKEKIEEFKDDKENDTKIWLIANDTHENGIIGLSNCLHQEPGGYRVRCIFDPENVLPQNVDFNKYPYKDIQRLDLNVNAFKNNQMGTFRHITLPEEQEKVNTEHAYLNIGTRGDLRSLKWYDAPHKHWISLPERQRDPREVLCILYYSALNFKDVVISAGRIAPGPESAIFDCIIGMEFSGRRCDTGKRVMGMVPMRAFATSLISYKDFLWDIPDEWSLEDAATVPVVYCTAYYSLITRGNLQEGESVLIHSGAGGVGQSAIYICQSMNCEVFTTVGTEEKREFIKKKFNLDDDHIGNSRDTSFEKQFMTVTKGKGINVVLNSLVEDKLQASVRCLSANGRFLEIGKLDMQMNNNLGLFALIQNITFHAIGMDVLFREGPNSKTLQNFMKEMSRLLNDGIKKGVVKPIERTTFEMESAEEAFRYMLIGKHIGKVLIKIRDEENEKIMMNPKPLIVVANTKTWFNPSKVYIIIGGLGGCGMELAYWMVLRGAKKIILTSRYGIKNPNQQLYLKRFKEMSKIFDEFKNDVIISTNNVNIMEEANELINEANTYGAIGGIFNLALVLNDAILENQTIETFTDTCEPKVDALMNLDVISREKCPHLDYFVAFSSLTSGRGNAGQTNYGYANSVMERICEERKRKGLPGMAIQWGVIGDVGIVAEQLLSDESKSNMMKSLSGILPQRFASCIEVLDRFLQLPYPIVSSFVKADLDAANEKSEDDAIAQFCALLHLDRRSPDETLGEIGLESMMSVEIQQRLERDYDLVLSLADVRKITAGELKEFRDGNRDELRQYSTEIKAAKINLLQMKFELSSDPLTLINDGKTGKPIYVLPPVEGITQCFEELAKLIDRPVYALNWSKSVEKMNFKDIKSVGSYFKNILKQHSPDGDYDIFGHSFGAVVGIQMIRKRVPIKNLIIIDATDAGTKDKTKEEDDRFGMIWSYLRAFLPSRVIKKIQREVMNMKGANERITKLIELLREYGGKGLHGKNVDEIIRGSFQRSDMISKYKHKKLDNFNRKIQQKINRQIKIVTVDVTVVKLVNDERDLEKTRVKMLHEYGVKREDIVGEFNIHPIVGTESDLLKNDNGNLQTIAKIINQKLC